MDKIIRTSIRQKYINSTSLKFDEIQREIEKESLVIDEYIVNYYVVMVMHSLRE